MAAVEKTGAQVRIGRLTEPNLPKTDGGAKWYKKVREMRRDPTIKMVRQLVVAPVLAAEWSFEEKKSAPPGAVDLLRDTVLPIKNYLLRTSYLGCVDFGWQPYEKVFEYEWDTGLVHVKKFKQLLQDFTEIIVACETGAFAGVEQDIDGTPIRLETQDTLLVSFDVEGTDWYGEAVMRAAEKAYDAWNEVERVSARYDRKIAGSHWVIYYPLGSSDFEGSERPNSFIAQEILNNLYSSGSVIVPSRISDVVDDLNANAPNAWNIELMTDSGTARSSFIDRARYLDSLKARALGVPERSVLEGQFGTKAEAEAHADFALTNIELRHQELVDTYNWHWVNQWLRLNWGPQAENTVKIVVSPLSDFRRGVIRKVYETLLANPEALAQEISVIDMEALREKMGIPIMAPEAMPYDPGAPPEDAPPDGMTDPALVDPTAPDPYTLPGLPDVPADNEMGLALSYASSHWDPAARAPVSLRTREELGLDWTQQGRDDEGRWDEGGGGGGGGGGKSGGKGGKSGKPRKPRSGYGAGKDGKTRDESMVRRTSSDEFINQKHDEAVTAEATASGFTPTSTDPFINARQAEAHVVAQAGVSEQVTQLPDGGSSVLRAIESPAPGQAIPVARARAAASLMRPNDEVSLSMMDRVKNAVISVDGRVSEVVTDAATKLVNAIKVRVANGIKNVPITTPLFMARWSSTKAPTPVALAWNPDQPRDPDGKFGSMGGSGGGGMQSGGSGVKTSFPKEGRAGLTVVKSLGGSTGAQLLRDKDGNKFVYKTGKNSAHVESEHRANEAYRAMGIKVPETQLYKDQASGKSYTLNEFIDGSTVNKFSGEHKEAVYAEIRKNFVADAVLGNWDAIGLDQDNVLVGQSDDDVYRIDNGGALGFRAQGAPKGAAWDEKVSELQTLRDPKMNYAAAQVYGSLTDEEIVGQMKEVVGKKSAVLKTLEGTPDHDIVRARFETLEKKLGSSKPDVLPEPAKGSPGSFGTKSQGEKIDEMTKFIKSPSFKNKYNDKIVAKQAENIAKMNDGTDDTTLFVPLTAFNSAQLAELQTKFPDKKIVKVNVAKFKSPANEMPTLKPSKAPLTKEEKQWAKDATKTGKPLTKSEAKVAEAAEKAPLYKGPSKSYKDPKNPEIKHIKDGETVYRKDAFPDATLSSELKLTSFSADEWSKNMPAHQRGTINGFTKANFRKLREAELVKPNDPKVKALHAALDTAPTFEGVTYRGLRDIQPGSVAYEKFTTVGGIVDMRQTSSSSRSFETAHQQFSLGNTVLRIRGKTGVPVEHISAYGHEKEVMMRHNSKYRVLGVSKNLQIKYTATSKTGFSLKLLVDLEEI